MHLITQKLRLIPYDVINKHLNPRQFLPHLHPKALSPIYIPGIETNGCYPFPGCYINRPFIMERLRYDGNSILGEYLFQTYHRIKGSKACIILENNGRINPCMY